MIFFTIVKLRIFYWFLSKFTIDITFYLPLTTCYINQMTTILIFFFLDFLEFYMVHSGFGIILIQDIKKKKKKTIVEIFVHICIMNEACLSQMMPHLGNGAWQGLEILSMADSRA